MKVTKYIKIGLCVLVVGVIGKTGWAQVQPAANQKNENKPGLMLLIGPSAYYFQGSPDDDFDSFSSKRIAYQMNGFLGYSTAKKHGGNALGVFGTAGYTSERIFNNMLTVQEMTTDDLMINKYFVFYQVEAGVIIANVLRFSSGVGKQEFTTTVGDDQFNYLSTTAGLLINFGPVMWNIDANFNYGRDLPNTSLKIATGLLVKF